MIRDLCKDFSVDRHDPKRVTALDHVDIDVAEGTFATVLGPSGCGKTTLLRAIAGFESPDSGSISVAGRPVFGPGTRTVPAHDRGIGLVPQEGALFPHLTVAQNVGFGLTGISVGRRRHRVDEILDLVGLGHLGRRRPHALSGGQQQRVALARAIAPNPRVILLDEPFSSLDAYLREALRTEVRGLLKSIGATVVLVTHDQEEALTLGDQVIVMRNGRVVQSGAPRETYFHPTDIELARFLGDAVVIDGQIDEQLGEQSAGPVTVSCAFGCLPVGSWHGCPGRCDVLIRPENIRVNALDSPMLERDQSAGSTGTGLSGTGLIGTVLGQEFYGHDGVLRVQVPELRDHVTVRIMGDRPFGVGEQVQLCVDRPVCTYAS